MHCVAQSSQKVGRKWGFNPEHMVEADYSHSTAILLMLYPDTLLNDIEDMGIGLIVHQYGAPLGQVSSIPQLIKYTHSLLEFEGESFTPICRTYCILYELQWAFGLCHGSSILHGLCIGFH